MLGFLDLNSVKNVRFLDLNSEFRLKTAEFLNLNSEKMSDF